MLTVERVRELLNYDPETGLFTWKHSRGTARKGNLAGYARTTQQGKTYWVIRMDRVSHLAHRLAWVWMYGTVPEDQIDHVDGNGTNNAIANLRTVSLSENMKNKRKQANNTSGVTGVSWEKNSSKWEVRIMIGGKSVYFGRYADFQQAVSIRKKAETLYGFHSNHGSDRPL